MLPILACENAVGLSKISAPQIIAALDGILNNIASSLLEMPVSDAGGLHSFLLRRCVPAAVILRTVKPPPYEVGGSSWLGVALDLTVGYTLSSGLRRDRISARG